MSRSNRLLPVVELARKNERDAAAGLSESMQRKAEAETRLTQLVEFLEDYIHADVTREQEGLLCTRLYNRRAFIGKLNQIVTQQREQTDRAADDAARQRQQWQQACAYVKSLEKVVARYRRDETARREHREQRETDERAQRNRTRLGVT